MIGVYVINKKIKVKVIFNLSHVLQEKELILLKRGLPMNLFWSKLEKIEYGTAHDL